ncbi:MAG: hypothetical protein HON99_12740, partial [Crocinitomicaceae bacterium]|nr:hypothetical protein [Crocinitomicaceae bacterium]
MKRYLRFISISVILLVFTSNFQAQHINYKDDSGWNLGFNIGGTWQQSDVTSETGYGIGFTLGKALYEKEGKLLSFDLRLRYLNGTNEGLDTENSLILDSNQLDGLYKDYINSGNFHNHKMDINNMWDLEGVITLNRLREKTGIILYGFGGLGITDYSLNTDLLGEDGMPYDYTALGNSASESTLRDLRDGDYETTVSDGYKFMPSLGAGIGYQFSPRFSAGIEHKINFPLNDKIDAFEATGGPFVNDRLHYTALTFRWNLFRGGRNRPTVATTTPVSPAPLRNKPVVNIINPIHSPYATHNNNFTVKANVYYVAGKSNITFRHNGLISNDFSYNSSSKRFTSHLFLVPGKNIIEIIGKNEAGYDSESKVIIYEQAINALPPPIVTFLNPSYSPQTVSNQGYSVTANIMHILGPQDVTFKVNGVINPSFIYNVSNQLFSANILLSQGQNTIEIKGTNSVGQDIESVMIIYNKPIQLRPPLVNFTDPLTSPTRVDKATYNVSAQVLNVDYYHQVQVLLNGINIPSFGFDPSAHTVAFQASLLEGSNTITVIATNNDGTDSKATNIIFEPVNELPPPIVTVTSPSQNPENTNMPSAVVYANVLNVDGKSNIDLKINGVTTTNFTYNTISKVMTVATALVEGPNVFSITGTNEVGTDNAGTTIIYEKPSTLLPPVISITKPNVNPYNTINSNEIINATILHVSSASHVNTIFNGVNTTTFAFDPVSRKFSFSGSLIVGANILEINAWNEVGSASKSQIIIYTNEAPPCENPVISITQPESQLFVTASDKITVFGKIKDAQQVLVKINGENHSEFTYNGASGELVITNSKLQEGANVYDIIAKNNCGSTDYRVTIIYKKKAPPCIEPSIELISPNAYSSNVIGTTLKFAAAISHVKSNASIKLTLNNVAIPFTFNKASNQVTSGLKLKEGANLLIITGKNECGSDEAQIKIIAEEIVVDETPPPTVEFTMPNSSSYTTENASFVVMAKTEYIISSSEISVQLEGSGLPFTFNPLANTVSIPVSLDVGTHDLNIMVSNSHGSAKDEVELIYKVEEPCNLPVIKMDPQFNNRLTVNVGSGQITGLISDAAVITIKRDGSNYSDFVYNNTTGRIEINYSSLQRGYNEFKIVAHNPCGKDIITVLLDFDPPIAPCDKPVLVIAEASGSVASVSADNGMFTAYIGNASDASVQKDGSGHSNFTFDPGNGNMVVNYSNLHDGDNVFTIIGSNDCGDTSNTYTLQYDAPDIPCDNPQINVVTVLDGTTLSVTGQSDYLVFSISNATSIGVTRDGFNHSDYVVKPSIGQLIVKLTSLNAGTNEFIIIAQNDCGTADKTVNVVYGVPSNNEPCGPRFNPGSSDWEFCLITPSGTFNRNDLNSGFSYSGPASSAYFKPIAGGGNAVVNGSSYPLSNGQYYLFTGVLTVDVGSNHAGSNGHWEICIESNATPVHGNGSKRPDSPCSSKTIGNSSGNSSGNTKNGNSNNGLNGNGSDSKNQGGTDDSTKNAAAKQAAENAKKAAAAKQAAENAKKAAAAKQAAEN